MGSKNHHPFSLSLCSLNSLVLTLEVWEDVKNVVIVWNVVSEQSEVFSECE